VPRHGRTGLVDGGRPADGPGVGGTGPYDVDDLPPDLTDAAGRVDFGALRLPVPAAGSVTVEPSAGGRLTAVQVTLPRGHLSISALAAPRSARLWPELVREIDTSLRDGGARVWSYTGEWGRELHARTGPAASIFVGVDGPRWMLYGVATGPTAAAPELDAELRRLLRGTVVVRGRSPYPVRTVLPLTMPEELAPEVPGTGVPPPPALGPVVAGGPAGDPERTGVIEPVGPAADPERTGVIEPVDPAADPERTGPIGPVAPAVSGTTDPVTEPLPAVHQPPTEPPTEPHRIPPGTEPDPPTGPAATAPARDQPALAFLMGDPLDLFAPPRTGRHHRPD